MSFYDFSSSWFWRRGRFFLLFGLVTFLCFQFVLIANKLRTKLTLKATQTPKIRLESNLSLLETWILLQEGLAKLKLIGKDNLVFSEQQHLDVKTLTLDPGFKNKSLVKLQNSRDVIAVLTVFLRVFSGSNKDFVDTFNTLVDESVSTSLFREWVGFQDQLLSLTATELSKLAAAELLVVQVNLEETLYFPNEGGLWDLWFTNEIASVNQISGSALADLQKLRNILPILEDNQKFKEKVLKPTLEFAQLKKKLDTLKQIQQQMEVADLLAKSLEPMVLEMVELIKNIDSQKSWWFSELEVENLRQFDLLTLFRKVSVQFENNIIPSWDVLKHKLKLFRYDSSPLLKAEMPSKEKLKPTDFFKMQKWVRFYNQEFISQVRVFLQQKFNFIKSNLQKLRESIQDNHIRDHEVPWLVREALTLLVKVEQQEESTPFFLLQKFVDLEVVELTAQLEKVIELKREIEREILDLQENKNPQFLLFQRRSWKLWLEQHFFIEKLHDVSIKQVYFVDNNGQSQLLDIQLLYQFVGRPLKDWTPSAIKELDKFINGSVEKFLQVFEQSLKAKLNPKLTVLRKMQLPKFGVNEVLFGETKFDITAWLDKEISFVLLPYPSFNYFVEMLKANFFSHQNIGKILMTEWEARVNRLKKMREKLFQNQIQLKHLSGNFKKLLLFLQKWEKATDKTLLEKTDLVLFDLDYFEKMLTEIIRNKERVTTLYPDWNVKTTAEWWRLLNHNQMLERLLLSNIIGINLSDDSPFKRYLSFEELFPYAGLPFADLPLKIQKELIKLKGHDSAFIFRQMVEEINKTFVDPLQILDKFQLQFQTLGIHQLLLGNEIVPITNFWKDTKTPYEMTLADLEKLMVLYFVDNLEVLITETVQNQFEKKLVKLESIYANYPVISSSLSFVQNGEIVTKTFLILQNWRKNGFSQLSSKDRFFILHLDSGFIAKSLEEQKQFVNAKDYLSFVKLWSLWKVFQQRDRLTKLVDLGFDSLVFTDTEGKQQTINLSFLFNDFLKAQRLSHLHLSLEKAEFFVLSLDDLTEWEKIDSLSLSLRQIVAIVDVILDEKGKTLLKGWETFWEVKNFLAPRELVLDDQSKLDMSIFNGVSWNVAHWSLQQLRAFFKLKAYGWDRLWREAFLKDVSKELAVLEKYRDYFTLLEIDQLSFFHPLSLEKKLTLDLGFLLTGKQEGVEYREFLKQLHVLQHQGLVLEAIIKDNIDAKLNSLLESFKRNKVKIEIADLSSLSLTGFGQETKQFHLNHLFYCYLTWQTPPHQLSFEQIEQLWQFRDYDLDLLVKENIKQKWNEKFFQFQKLRQIVKREQILPSDLASSTQAALQFIKSVWNEQVEDLDVDNLQQLINLKPDLIRIKRKTVSDHISEIWTLLQSEFRLDKLAIAQVQTIKFTPFWQENEVVVDVEVMINEKKLSFLQLSDEVKTELSKFVHLDYQKEVPELVVRAVNEQLKEIWDNLKINLNRLKIAQIVFLSWDKHSVYLPFFIGYLDVETPFDFVSLNTLKELAKFLQLKFPLLDLINQSIDQKWNSKFLLFKKLVKKIKEEDIPEDEHIQRVITFVDQTDSYKNASELDEQQLKTLIDLWLLFIELKTNDEIYLIPLIPPWWIKSFPPYDKANKQPDEGGLDKEETNPDGDEDTDVDSDVDTEETDVDSDGDTDVDSDGDTDVDSDGDTDVDSDGDTDVDSDGDTDVDSDGDTDVDSDGDTGVDSDGDTDVDSDGDTEETDLDSDGDTEETDLDSDGDTEETNPDGDGGTNPDGDGGTNPDGDGGTNPDGDGGTNPDGDGEKSPDGDGEKSPDSGGGTNPDSSGEKSPDGDGGKSPDGDGEKSPDGDGGTNPDGDGGTNPDGDGGTNPDGDGGTNPDSSGEKSPDSGGGTNPDGDGGTNPDGDGVTNPDSGGEKSPDSGGGTNPDSSGEKSPDSGGGTNPDSSRGKSPDGDGGTNPDSSGEKSPDSGGGTNPDGDGGTNPDSSGEKSPDGDGGTNPDGDGVTNPDGDGVTNPDSGGEKSPDSGGGTNPDSSGEKSPDSGGGTNPDSSRGKSPDGDGGTNPDGDGGTNPDGDGGTNPDGDGGTNPDGDGGTNPDGDGGEGNNGNNGDNPNSNNVDQPNAPNGNGNGNFPNSSGGLGGGLSIPTPSIGAGVALGGGLLAIGLGGIGGAISGFLDWLFGGGGDDDSDFEYIPKDDFAKDTDDENNGGDRGDKNTSNNNNNILTKALKLWWSFFRAKNRLDKLHLVQQTKIDNLLITPLYESRRKNFSAISDEVKQELKKCLKIWHLDFMKAKRRIQSIFDNKLENQLKILRDNQQKLKTILVDKLEEQSLVPLWQNNLKPSQLSFPLFQSLVFFLNVDVTKMITDKLNEQLDEYWQEIIVLIPRIRIARVEEINFAFVSDWEKDLNTKQKEWVRNWELDYKDVKFNLDYLSSEVVNKINRIGDIGNEDADLVFLQNLVQLSFADSTFSELVTKIINEKWTPKLNLVHEFYGKLKKNFNIWSIKNPNVFSEIQRIFYFAKEVETKQQADDLNNLQLKTLVELELINLVDLNINGVDDKDVSVVTLIDDLWLFWHILQSENRLEKLNIAGVQKWFLSLKSEKLTGINKINFALLSSFYQEKNYANLPVEVKLELAKFYSLEKPNITIPALVDQALNWHLNHFWRALQKKLNRLMITKITSLQFKNAKEQEIVIDLNSFMINYHQYQVSDFSNLDAFKELAMLKQLGIMIPKLFVKLQEKIDQPLSGEEVKRIEDDVSELVDKAIDQKLGNTLQQLQQQRNRLNIAGIWHLNLEADNLNSIVYLRHLLIQPLDIKPSSLDDDCLINLVKLFGKNVKSLVDLAINQKFQKKLETFNGKMHNLSKEVGKYYQCEGCGIDELWEAKILRNMSEQEKHQLLSEENINTFAKKFLFLLQQVKLKIFGLNIEDETAINFWFEVFRSSLLPSQLNQQQLRTLVNLNENFFYSQLVTEENWPEDLYQFWRQLRAENRLEKLAILNLFHLETIALSGHPLTIGIENFIKNKDLTFKELIDLTSGETIDDLEQFHHAKKTIPVIVAETIDKFLLSTWTEFKILLKRLHIAKIEQLSLYEKDIKLEVFNQEIETDKPSQFISLNAFRALVALKDVADLTSWINQIIDDKLMAKLAEVVQQKERLDIAQIRVVSLSNKDLQYLNIAQLINVSTTTKPSNLDDFILGDLVKLYDEEKDFATLVNQEIDKKWNSKLLKVKEDASSLELLKWYEFDLDEQTREKINFMMEMKEKTTASALNNLELKKLIELDSDLVLRKVLKKKEVKRRKTDFETISEKETDRPVDVGPEDSGSGKTGTDEVEPGKVNFSGESSGTIKKPLDDLRGGGDNPEGVSTDDNGDSEEKNEENDEGLEKNKKAPSVSNQDKKNSVKSSATKTGSLWWLSLVVVAIILFSLVTAFVVKRQRQILPKKEKKDPINRDKPVI